MAAVAYNLNDVLRFAVVFAILLGIRFLGVPKVFELAFTLAALGATWATVAGWYGAVAWVDIAFHAGTGGTAAVVALFALAKLRVPPVDGTPRRAPSSP